MLLRFDRCSQLIAHVGAIRLHGCAAGSIERPAVLDMATSNPLVCHDQERSIPCRGSFSTPYGALDALLNILGSTRMWPITTGYYSSRPHAPPQGEQCGSRHNQSPAHPICRGEGTDV